MTHEEAVLRYDQIKIEGNDCHNLRIMVMVLHEAGVINTFTARTGFEILGMELKPEDIE